MLKYITFESLGILISGDKNKRPDIQGGTLAPGDGQVGHSENSSVIHLFFDPGADCVCQPCLSLCLVTLMLHVDAAAASMTWSDQKPLTF